MFLFFCRIFKHFFVKMFSERIKHAIYLIQLLKNFIFYALRDISHKQCNFYMAIEFVERTHSNLKKFIKVCV